MTETQAKAILSGKLIFGDENQIKARKFLEQLEMADEAFRNCKSVYIINDGTYANQVGAHYARCSCLGKFSDEVIVSLDDRYSH